MICRKHLFDLPKGVIYLDGNSLGPLPRAVAPRLAQAVAGEWGQMLITGWNAAGWMDQPMRVGDMVARLIGAPAGSVVMGDTLSIKVFQALAAALAMRPDRRVILSDSGNFPTDLYIADGLIATLGQGHELRVVAPEALPGAIDDSVAALLVTEVDYRTGARHDMAALTARAQAAGAVVIRDLAHSAGAFPIDLHGCEFAVGCSYKYLNGGPGAPAFIHIRPDLAEQVRPALAGWMGHDQPFAFDLDYRPAMSVERMRVGTPPVLQMTALEAALGVWDGVDMDALRAESLRLADLFIDGVTAACPMLELVTPREPARRGSQVSFRFGQGYAAMQALIARGVIGDFRAPDIMRFGITPLYLDDSDIEAAVDIIARVMAEKTYERPEFQTRARVT